MKKRFLAVALVLCMTLNLLPTEVFAAENTMMAKPNVTQLTVSGVGGEPVNLLGGQPAVSISAGSKPVFAISFGNIEPLNRVFVTSTKGGETKYLEATLQQDGNYITDGYFDPNDTDYIPGTISVAYSPKTVKVNESENVGGVNLSTLSTELSKQGISIHEASETDDGTISAQILLNNVLSETSEVFLDAAISEFAGDDADALTKWLGACGDLTESAAYRITGVDDKEYDLYLKFVEKVDETGFGEDYGDTFFVILKSITDNKYTKSVIQLTDKSQNLDVIADELSTANTAASAIYDYYTITKESNELRNEIEQSTMSPEEKRTAYSKIDALENDRKWFLMGMTMLPVLVGSTALTGGAAGILFSAYLAGISATSDYFWERRIGLIQGCEPIENAFSEIDDHGSGWTALTNDSVDEGSSSVITINEDGQYFMAADVSKTIYIGLSEGGAPINATICLHGHKNSSAVIIRSNSTLRICDCKYHEYEDGTAVGGTVKVNAERGHKFVLDSGIIDSAGVYGIPCNGGEIVINGGIVHSSDWSSIYNANGGKITINGGTIEGGVCAKGGGEITINDGKIIGYADVSRFSDETSWDAGLWTDSGKITINNGQVTCIANDAGEVIINDAILTNSEESSSHPGIWNYHGTISVNDGIIGRIINENGTVNIRGGLMKNYAQGVLNQAGGTVNITGGQISTANSQGTGIQNNGGNVIISGGIINGYSGSVDNNNDGTVTISGGTIQNGLSNDGTVMITGGTIKGQYGAIGNSSSGVITISSGTIIGTTMGISNTGTGKVNLVIDQNSDILVDGGNSKAFWLASGASSIPTSVTAAANYSGGVTYYNAAGTQGTPMTIEEAATADYTGSYVRLVASGAVSGNDKVTVTPSTGGNVTFTPSEPADGDTVTITVTPDSGYQGGAPVVKDSGGNTIPVTDAGNGKYTFTKPAGQVTITAPEFTRPTYSVTAPVSTPNGSVTVSAAAVHEGDTVTITVTPNAGYQGSVPVVKDADGNTLAITDAGNGKYTFVMPAKNVVVTAAEFTPTSYTITGPSKPSNGTVSLSAATAHKGDTVTITVTPDVNFTAKTPVVTGASGNVAVTKVSDTTYTFVMPEGNVTVDASFSVINFTLAYTPYASMTDADKKLYYGGKLEITGLVPNTKYVVTFDNGLAAPKQVNGRNVIPRIAHVVTSDAAGKVALGCQDSMNVMVFGVSNGGNVTTDLVELYAKNHAGVPVSGLASRASGT